jgi:hypothetical protein
MLEPRIELIKIASDWLATRLSDRKFYPPKKNYVSQKAVPGRPQLITIEGIEGVEVCFGQIKGVRCLMLRLALYTPFIEDVLDWVFPRKAVWNSIFNVWELPIISKTETDALKEIWNYLEEILFADIFYDFRLKIYWRWRVSDSNFKILQHRINRLKSKIFPDVAGMPHKHSCVVPGLDLESLLLKKPKSWNSEQWQVNDIRHNYSSYLALLTQIERYNLFEYKQVFVKVNNAIAYHYPELAVECDRQINNRFNQISKH